MSPLAVQLMLKRRLRATGLPKILSPHSFGVLVVTDLLSQNVPLEDVQYLAGHAHPRSTQIYDPFARLSCLNYAGSMKRQRISRRRALSGLAALAAVPGNANRVWAGSVAPISAGVLTEATGGHLRSYLQGFASARGVGRVAVSDPTGKKFDQAKSILGDRLAGLYRSHEEMLQKARPKLVVVTLEGHRSPPVIRMALEAGSHVITEKPGCARLEDFEPLVPLAQSQGRELMLAMSTRVSQAIQKARELIRKGYLGKPYSATMDWIADQTRLTRPEYHGLWVASKGKAGGGKLIYHGIHYLDVLQYLIEDRIDRISALCENVGGQPIEVEDAAVVTFRMRGGLVGTLNAGYYLDRFYQNQIRLWGSKGWMHLDLPSGDPLKWYSTHPDAPRGIQLFYYQDDPDLYGTLIQATVDFARGQAPAPMTAQECLHLMRVIFAGYRSAETGRTQDLG